MHLKEGYRLHNGKYQLLNIIGEGGFSLTYKGAWKTEVQGPLGKVPTQIPVCIKEYFFKDYCLRNPYTNFVETNSTTGNEIFDKYKEKIIKEARILSEIHHPNVVNVLEVFKQNNTVYTVMDFIDGISLKQDLERNGVFTEDKLLQIIFKIGQALQYIHNKNILHLDIKPSNILLDKNNNPQLIDFGISKRYDLLDQQETSTTIQAASKGYASIEQYDSEGTQSFTPCPDVYSLGATMYFLLTGLVPTESILRSTKGLQTPRELNPEVSEQTEAVIMKAMELQAADRYPSIMDMLLDLGFDPEKDATRISEGDDDNTELISKIGETPYDADAEDATAIQNNPEKQSDKKKSRSWIYILLCLLLSACILYFLENSEAVNPDPETTETSQNDIIFNQYFNQGKNHFNKNNLSQAEEEIAKALSIKEDVEARNYIRKIDSLKTLINEPEEPIRVADDTPQIKELPEVKTVDPEEERFNNLFRKATSTFNNRDFTAALTLYTEAQTIKKSPELESYITTCKSEIEKQETQKRKEKYEFFAKIGTFDIVKDKATNKFGAIDSKGIEKIPCKYKTSYALGDKRYFLREDDLYDVYSPQGEKTEEAISGE